MWAEVLGNFCEQLHGCCGAYILPDHAQCAGRRDKDQAGFAILRYLINAFGGLAGETVFRLLMQIGRFISPFARACALRTSTGSVIAHFR